jgi:hypothetical protein
MKYDLNNCRTIFFDLEYYVPIEKREGHGFKYNPWEEKSFLIGGSFLSVSPKSKDYDSIQNKIKSFWIWDYEGNEGKLIKDIYDFLMNDGVRKSHNGVSSVLCGINILHSDLPVILNLLNKYNIATNSELFTFQNSFRSIDLSILSIGAFNNNIGFLYPKKKAEITSKFYNQKLFDSGSSVWEMYDNKEFSKIKERVQEEIQITFNVYQKLIDYYNKNNVLLKESKKIAHNTD